MTNKQGMAQTRTESAVVNYLLSRGVQGVARMDPRKVAPTPPETRVVASGLPALAGLPGIHVEVKASEGSDAQLESWLDEMYQRASKHRTPYAVLVVKRKGHGLHDVGSWRAVTRQQFLAGEVTSFTSVRDWATMYLAGCFDSIGLDSAATS